MNLLLMGVYLDFYPSLESNICIANLAHRHVSLFQMKRGLTYGCPALLMQKNPLECM